MSFIDWSVMFLLLLFLIIAALRTKCYVRSVADYLAASRCAGRYILAVSEEMSIVGAILIIALFEAHYVAGFSIVWWQVITMVTGFVISLYGWVIYRFRRTRALTLGQFLELRYSKKFRIFAGILSFGCGLLRFGIFPGVAARFFLYLCEMPVTRLNFAIAMLILISVALFFTFIGGQIAILVTDFFQGFFSNIVYVLLVGTILLIIPWSNILEALQTAPENASMIHPFHTSRAKDFNFWFYLITAFTYVYGRMAWQSNQGYNVSATTPHEARMSKVLGFCKVIPLQIAYIFLPICAFVVMNHANWSGQAANVKSALAGIGNEKIISQVTTPLVLREILPKGILGAFSAVMLAAFISTNNSALHSWGSVFIQDVILPLRKRALTPKQHIKILRLSILFVALFTFLFSFLFTQTEYIFMYFAFAVTLWVGGAGAVIIGGLYWRKGTTTAAYVSVINGFIVGLTGFVLRRVWPYYTGNEFPVNPQWSLFFAMLSSSLLYVSVSLLSRKKNYNLDKLLHRGEYEIEHISAEKKQKKTILGKVLCIGPDFTFKDKVVYMVGIGWTLSWFVLFVIGTVYNVFVPVAEEGWFVFWKIYVYSLFMIAIIVTCWLNISGLFDLRKFFANLRRISADQFDDGIIRKEDDTRVLRKTHVKCPMAINNGEIKS